MLSQASTQDIEITEALIARLIKEVYTNKPAVNDIEHYQKLYKSAVENVLKKQYEQFGDVDLFDDMQKVMKKAERLFGKEAAEQLKPQTESLLTAAFKSGKTMADVPERIKQVFDQVHQTAIDWMVKHDGFWIGKVFPNYVAPVFKETIVSGIQAGLGRKTIARQLKNLTFGYGEVPGKSALYNRVATASINRARNWGSMFSLEEAGIETSVWRAVGDERTCSRCSYLNGREFSVPKLMNKVRLALKSKPEDIETISPWPGYDAEEDDYYVHSKYGRIYLKNKPKGWLEEHGIGLPPLHPHCRCQILAKVG